MKQESKGKAIKRMIPLDGSADEKAASGYDLSVKLGMNGSNSYIGNNYSYANRCTPWRYIEIFKNMTIRP